MTFILLAILAISLWTLIEALIVGFSSKSKYEKYDPAIYIRVSLLAALVGTGLSFVD